MLDGGLGRVLIAEDDPLVRNSLIRVAEQLGYVATAVSDGALALEAASACRPDLVLSDIRMPRLSGLELCRRLKAGPTTRQIAVVLITALGEEHRGIALAAGADGFLSKPFGAADLKAQMDTILGQRRLGAERPTTAR